MARPPPGPKHAACPVCDAALCHTQHDWELRCPRCGHLASTLETAIGVDALRFNEGHREAGLVDLRRNNFELILDRIEALNLPAGSALLDVGCAHGWFLDAAARRGFTVHGLEPDPRIAERAAKRGHDVTIGFFPKDVPRTARFDVICFNDVFEHLEDPKSALAGCHEHLSAHGLLVVNLPSSRGVFFRVATWLDRVGLHTPYERLWQKGFPSPHRSYFDPEGLARLAQREGFSEICHDSLEVLGRGALWRRLRYDKRTPLLALAAMWLGISVLAPFLRYMPADISVHYFRRTT